MRQVITVSQNPSMIAIPFDQMLLIRFPTLEKDRVVVQGTVKLTYNVRLTRETDVNAKFVNNLERAIIEKLSYDSKVSQSR